MQAIEQVSSLGTLDNKYGARVLQRFPTDFELCKKVIENDPDHRVARPGDKAYFSNLALTGACHALMENDLELAARFVQLAEQYGIHDLVEEQLHLSLLKKQGRDEEIPEHLKRCIDHFRKENLALDLVNAYLLLSNLDNEEINYENAIRTIEEIEKEPKNRSISEKIGAKRTKLCAKWVIDLIKRKKWGEAKEVFRSLKISRIQSIPLLLELEKQVAKLEMDEERMAILTRLCDLYKDQGKKVEVLDTRRSLFELSLEYKEGMELAKEYKKRGQMRTATQIYYTLLSLEDFEEPNSFRVHQLWEKLGGEFKLLSSDQRMRIQALLSLGMLNQELASLKETMEDRGDSH